MVTKHGNTKHEKNGYKVVEVVQLGAANVPDEIIGFVVIGPSGDVVDGKAFSTDEEALALLNKLADDDENDGGGENKPSPHYRP